MIRTVQHDGEPWWVCNPDDAGDLERFKDAVRSSATGEITDRLPTEAEDALMQRAIASRIALGEDPDKLFGIPLSPNAADRRQAP